MVLIEYGGDVVVIVIFVNQVDCLQWQFGVYFGQGQQDIQWCVVGGVFVMDNFYQLVVFWLLFDLVDMIDQYVVCGNNVFLFYDCYFVLLYLLSVVYNWWNDCVSGCVYFMVQFL